MDLIIKREKDTGTDAWKADQSKIRAALGWRRDRRIGDKMWKRSQRLYRGQHWDDDPDDDVTSDLVRDRITVNVTASTIQDFMPFLVRQRPTWILQARPKSDEPQALLDAQASGTSATHLLNYMWKEQQMQPEFRRAVEDGLVVGHGVVKTGWAHEIDAAMNPTKHGKIEMDSYIREGMPFMRRIDPYRFIFDPQAPDRSLRTARWCAEIMFMPLQDLIHNKVFEKKVRMSIGSGKEDPETVQSFLMTQQQESEGDFHSALTDDDLEGQSLVVLYQVWDKKFSKLRIYASGVEEPLFEQDAPTSHLDSFFPYVKWDFIPLNDEPYGLGIPAFIEDQQLELNRIRTSEFQHRRRHSLAKYGVMKGMLSEPEKSKILNGKDQVIEFGGPMNEVFSELNKAHINTDNYQIDGIIQEDIRRLTGQDQLLSGGQLPSRTSAKEIDVRQNLIGLKAQERVQRVDDFAEAIGKQIFQHMQREMSSTQIVRIQGPQADVPWAGVSPSDIKGDFDFELLSSSKEEFDPVQERQQRLQVWQLMMGQAELLLQMGLQLNVPAMTTWMMDSFNKPETEAFIGAAPPQPVAPPGQPSPEEVGLATTGQGQNIQAGQAQAASAVGGAAAGGGPQTGV